MIRLAFSTVACPDWTLARVAKAAAYHGFGAVEFRSEGPGGASFACEPGLTDPSKFRALLEASGVECAGLASGVRYDAQVFPPVLGHALGRPEASVEETKVHIELAAQLGAPFVRVFAFDPPEQTKRGMRAARRRILRRLTLAADAARNTGVRLLLENGGAFATGGAIASLLSEVGSDNLLACYALAPASLAGERPEDGVSALGWRLISARIKDLRTVRGRPGVLLPCALGAGMLPCESFARAVAGAPSARFLTFEWDAAWLAREVAMDDADTALAAAARALTGWVASSAPDSSMAAAPVKAFARA